MLLSSACAVERNYMYDGKNHFDAFSAPAINNRWSVGHSMCAHVRWPRAHLQRRLWRTKRSRALTSRVEMQMNRKNKAGMHIGNIYNFPSLGRTVALRRRRCTLEHRATKWIQSANQYEHRSHFINCYCCAWYNFKGKFIGLRYQTRRHIYM